MINDANTHRSVIKDWTKLRDWELRELLRKGYDRVVLELARRKDLADHYQTIDGTWAYRMGCSIYGKWATEEEAITAAVAHIRREHLVIECKCG